MFDLEGKVPQEIFDGLKIEYANQPAQLKFILAQERVLQGNNPEISPADIVGVTVEGLRDWVKNPLTNEPLEITGFAKLIREIMRYESDSFSAKELAITEDEALLVANRIIDECMGRVLSGALIYEALDEIRK